MAVRPHVERLLSSRSLVHALAVTTAGALALTISAQVRIPLPYTPVPITLQVLVVLLLGGLLGPRLGTAAVAQYLLLGIIGLPVFSGWSTGLVAWQKGVTVGYLIGFLAAAPLCGMLCARALAWRYHWRLAGAFLACAAGVLVIHLCGSAWLIGLSGCSLSAAFLLGSLPFVVIDIIKAGVAAAAIALREKGAA